MSDKNKTQFEVQKVMRDNILAGLSALGIDESKFTVMESSQTLPTSRNDCILFKLEGSSRLSWQGKKYRYDSTKQKLYRNEEFVDQQDWLISVMKLRRKPLDITTQTADDLANLLIVWFNSDGNAYFRKNGMANLVITDKPVEIYKSESSVFEKSASFRMKVQVPRAVEFVDKYGRLHYKGNIPL